MDDPKKTIAKYIGPSIGYTIMGWLFTGLAVVSLIIGAIAYTTTDEVPVPFDPAAAQSDCYAYVDVTGVSDWVCKDGSIIYYNAEDADGNLYTLRMTESKFKTLTAQSEYWERESGHVATPDPVRLYGMVEKLDFEVQNTLAEVWEVSSTQYASYFGSYYLNTTTSPSSENGTIWLMAALFCFLLGAAGFASVFAPNRNLKKCLSRLEARGELARAAEQLSSPDVITIGKDRGRLSAQYLYGKRTGVVLRYEDVEWCYKKTLRRNFMTVNAFLMVSTLWAQNLTAVNLGVKDKNEEIENALVTIAGKNPKALVGFTRENEAAYKERKKAASL